MRRKDDHLRGALLRHAQALADAEGMDAVSIRAIARRAGVAAGTVYNYFSGKDDILLALTEEYWGQTLLEMQTAVTSRSFCGQLEEIFTFLKSRIDRSAGMLMRSLGNVEEAGQRRMTAMQEALAAAVMRRMDQDAEVRADIWDETFTKERYARFIVMNMVSLLRARSPDIRFFVEIVRRTVY